MEMIVDLKHVSDEDQLLSILGDKLEFGGMPNNNIGWGMNWNALNDSLRYLDYGSIWGSSTKFSFPFKLTLINYELLATSDPESLIIFKEILETVKDFYKTKRNKIFEYSFS